jgi:hypothetical protein
VVDGVSIAEGQSWHPSCLAHDTRKRPQVWTKLKIGTHFRGHSNAIQKWIADCNIVLMGHWQQHIALRMNKKQ